MKKCSKKRILGIVTFALLLYFSLLTPVWAIPEDEEGKEVKDPDTRRLECLQKEAADYLNLYQVDLDAEGSDYTFTLNLNNNRLSQFPERRLSTPTFKVIRVLLVRVDDINAPVIRYYDKNMESLPILADTNNGNYLQSALGKTLSTREQLKLSISSSSFARAYIVLESTEPDEKFSQICDMEDMRSLIFITLDLYPEGNLVYLTEDEKALYQYPEAGQVQLITDENKLKSYWLNDYCATKYNTLPEFEKKFCDDYRAAANSGTEPVIFSPDPPKKVIVFLILLKLILLLPKKTTSTVSPLPQFNL